MKNYQYYQNYQVFTEAAFLVKTFMISESEAFNELKKHNDDFDATATDLEERFVKEYGSKYGYQPNSVYVNQDNEDDKDDINWKNKGYDIYSGPLSHSFAVIKAESDACRITNWEEYSIGRLYKICKEDQKNNKIKSKDFICSICQDEYYIGMMDEKDSQIHKKEEKMKSDKSLIKIVRLSKCKNHFFHKKCILGMGIENTSIKCPICNHIYGDFIGDMPKGKMYVKKTSQSCAGFEECGSIVIEYEFKAGMTKDKKYYDKTYRKAYLPDNKEGNDILKLLIKAFQKGITFTVGESTTTGAQNVIIWKGIHHKTSLYGGVEVHGYPDKTYLARVREELASHGVAS